MDILLFFTEILNMQKQDQEFQKKALEFYTFYRGKFYTVSKFFFSHINLRLLNNSGHAVYRQQYQYAERSICQEFPGQYRTQRASNIENARMQAPSQHRAGYKAPGATDKAVTVTSGRKEMSRFSHWFIHAFSVNIHVFM